jgi:hypothetical protein
LNAIVSQRKRPVHHLFQIRYDTGEEKWVAIENDGLSNQRIDKMKERIKNSEKRRGDRQIGALWYVGELAVLKP